MDGQEALVGEFVARVSDLGKLSRDVEKIFLLGHLL
jgi:hypothetical protein